jgi:cytochrome P450
MESPVDEEPTYDLFDPGYVADPFPLWERLRDECPVARSEKWGGSWMVTRHDDVVAVAHDPARFSSSSITLLPRPAAARAMLPAGSPPITSDPPEHKAARRPLATWFTPRRARDLEPFTRNLCRRLVRDLVAHGRCDAATQYARRIPVAVLGTVLGVPDERGEEFVELVRDVFSSPDDARRLAAITSLVEYFTGLMAERRATPGPDLVSALLHNDGDLGMSDEQVLGTVSLVLVAGIDTAASVLGSALWHLATHEEDRKRLVAEPQLVPTPVDELLRAYSPSTMARIVTTDTELQGRQLRQGDRVLLNFPSANRDGRAIEDADRVVIDRRPNRHLAFGTGIHHCVGAHLARMELRVGLSEWLRAVPEFRLDPESDVVWAAGQARGPLSLPLVLAAG